MSDYARALGARLREVRGQQGLSLQGVEDKSRGRWKAVVIGSYERGDRAVSVQKLAELAAFYGIPIAELLPGARPVRGGEPATKVILNLERLNQLPVDQAGPLARYVATIQSQRGDYNGQQLSIRSDDLKTLAIVYDVTSGELTDQLISWGVLEPQARPGRDELVDQLHAALARRALLEQAKGVLAERTGLQIDQAFDLLREHVRSHGLTIDDVATAIIDGSLEDSPSLIDAEGRSLARDNQQTDAAGSQNEISSI
ncbi:MAG: ANTAR domain-containing protein [Geodermatophilaceae bacterium]|nr:ANTAR domain-containing protein [Geodermatophilaceae bacterium]